MKRSEIENTRQLGEVQSERTKALTATTGERASLRVVDKSAREKGEDGKNASSGGVLFIVGPWLLKLGESTSKSESIPQRVRERRRRRRCSAGV
jgi:hypothetical protein